MINRVALITGAARGIGYGIANTLAKESFNLVINDIVNKSAISDNLARLEQHGVDVLYCQADVSRPEDRRRMLSDVEQRFGLIHVLVNNAGVAPEVRPDILKATEKSFERLIRINLQGPYFLIQAVANMMIEKKSKKKEPFFCIINIASSNSRAACTDQDEYCISKAGVSMATKLWAVRLGEFNIPVYEIRPGIIKTDTTAPVTEKYDKLIEEGSLLQKQWDLPEDVGHAVAMLARGDLEYSSGQILYVDGGQLAPRL